MAPLHPATRNTRGRGPLALRTQSSIGVNDHAGGDVSRHASSFPKPMTRLVSLLALVAGLGAGASGVAQREPFDLVLAGGRVMDPASGLDAIRHVGIRGATIAAVSATPLTGRTTVDVSGLVV